MSRAVLLVALAVLGVLVGGLTSGSRAQTTSADCPPAVTADVKDERDGLRIDLAGTTTPRSLDVLQHSAGAKLVAAKRVARLTVTDGHAEWKGDDDVADGVYTLRSGSFTSVIRRANGRWTERPAAQTGTGCGLVADLRATKPAFGGAERRTLRVTYAVAAEATVGVEVLHGGKVISRTKPGLRKAGVTYTLRLPSRGLPRGDYTFRLTATRGTEKVTARVVSRRV